MKLINNYIITIQNIIEFVLTHIHYLEILVDSFDEPPDDDSSEEPEKPKEKPVKFSFSNPIFVYFSWYTVELFGVKCVNNLSNTILYQISYGIWIVHIIQIITYVSKFIVPSKPYENVKNVEKDVENAEKNVENANDIINPINTEI
jgi:hypothetical protein